MNLNFDSVINLYIFAAAITTFVRFFPVMKARYDYGLLVFILTFSLVAVSAFRDDGVLDTAHSRLSTIIIGSCIAIIVCICVCPVWIGEDLHNLVAANLEKLGKSLQGIYLFFYITQFHSLTLLNMVLSFLFLFFS